jgi:serine/threonine protein kinase
VQPLVTGRNELLRAKYDGVDVCLKVFPLQGDMGAYKREFMRVQRLRHPCIVSFSAAFEDNGSMYLEMEYYPHGSLRHWLETSLPDAAQKRRVLRQALLALACVHSQGIVHSDIKGEVRATVLYASFWLASS